MKEKNNSDLMSHKLYANFRDKKVTFPLFSQTN